MSEPKHRRARSRWPSRGGRRLSFSLLLILLLGRGEPIAATRTLLAVFPLDSRGAPLRREVLLRLTDYLATRFAASSVYRVIPRDQLKQRLVREKTASYRACYDPTCQIEIGRELAAQKTLAARVMKIGHDCVVTATIYDLRTAASDQAAEARGSCSAEEVMSSLGEVASKLVGPPLAEVFKQRRSAALPPVQPLPALPSATERERPPVREMEVAEALKWCESSKHDPRLTDRSLTSVQREPLIAERDRVFTERWGKRPFEVTGRVLDVLRHGSIKLGAGLPVEQPQRFRPGRAQEALLFTCFAEGHDPSGLRIGDRIRVRGFFRRAGNDELGKCDDLNNIVFGTVLKECTWSAEGGGVEPQVSRPHTVSSRVADQPAAPSDRVMAAAPRSGSSSTAAGSSPSRVEPR